CRLGRRDVVGAAEGASGGSLLCQAEDGIRDWTVTVVQTCALPISGAVGLLEEDECGHGVVFGSLRREGTERPVEPDPGPTPEGRSEERRVGEERGALGAALQ